MKSKFKSSVAAETVAKVYGTMKRYSSRKTGEVSLSRVEIAEKLNFGARTVDNAIATLKSTKNIRKNGHRYIIVK